MQNDGMYAKFNIYYKLFIYESGFFTLYKLIKNYRTCDTWTRCYTF